MFLPYNVFFSNVLLSRLQAYCKEEQKHHERIWKDLWSGWSVTSSCICLYRVLSVEKRVWIRNMFVCFFFSPLLHSSWATHDRVEIKHLSLGSQVVFSLSKTMVKMPQGWPHTCKWYKCIWYIHTCRCVYILKPKESLLKQSTASPTHTYLHSFLPTANCNHQIFHAIS